MTYHDRTIDTVYADRVDDFASLVPSQRAVPFPKQALPLYVVDDMASAKRRFAAMGFQLEGFFDKPGAVSMKAGDSQILLIEQARAEDTLPPEVISSLKHGPALYIWVDSIIETRSRLADPVIAEMVTGYGTWELFVESRIGLIIFAEKLAGQDS